MCGNTISNVQKKKKTFFPWIDPYMYSIRPWTQPEQTADGQVATKLAFWTSVQHVIIAEVGVMQKRLNNNIKNTNINHHHL